MIFRRTLSIATLIGALLASVSLASPAVETAEQRDSYPMDPKPANKTVEMAYASMLLGTVVPIAMGSLLASRSEDSDLAPWLIVGGVFLGPSTGQFYANSVGTGILSSAIRFGGAALFLSGALSGLGGEGDRESGSGRMLAGTMVFIGGTFYSLIDTHLAVDRYRQQYRSMSLGISPTLGLARGGEMQPGAMAYLRF